ncbi:MAG TPA: hypothetical protein VK116_03910, partial [Planctomycetota bacterium]|nr:hypothetical protein [Planctomycetota bacterium]
AQGFLGFVAFFYQPKDPPSVSSLGMRQDATSAPLDPSGASRSPAAGETPEARREAQALPGGSASDAEVARDEASTIVASPTEGRPWFDGHAISASVHQTVGFVMYAVAIAFASRAWRRARREPPGGDPETTIATGAEVIAETQAGGRA